MEQSFDTRALLASKSLHTFSEQRRIDHVQIITPSGRVVPQNVLEASEKHLAKYYQDFDPDLPWQPDEFLEDLSLKLEMSGIDSTEEEQASMIAWAITGVSNHA